MEHRAQEGEEGEVEMENNPGYDGRGAGGRGVVGLEKKQAGDNDPPHLKYFC